MVLSLGNDLSLTARINPHGTVGGCEGQPALHDGAQIECDGAVAGARVDRAGPLGLGTEEEATEVGLPAQEIPDAGRFKWSGVWGELH